MSAVRSSQKRRSNRTTLSSPYSRPAPKKSSWSLLGFLSFLNPLKGTSTESQHDSESTSETEEDISYASDEGVDAPQNLSARGQEIQSSLRQNGRANGHAIVSPPPPPPPTFTFSQPPTTSPASRSAPVQAAASPDQNLALAYLSERRGKGMSDVEVDGLISLLQQNSSTPKAEPFRFTTPLKSQSPAPLSNSLPSLNATTPRRTLTRNPNGVYRWEGGGSAKRSRNRYHSPAFGPPRTTPDRLKLSNPPSETPPVPRMDTKRRRVGEDAASSSTTPSGSATPGHPVHMKTPSPPPRASAPGPSPTRAAQAYPFPAFQGPLSPSPTTNGATNGSASQTQDKTSAATTTPTRLRIPQKPTTPVIPSPLRQTWSQQGDGSPPQAGPSQSQPQRQTMAANFMSELIKEVTPPKRPDVSNPYQTASPVKLPSRPKSSRPRATGKPTAVNGKAAREAASKGEDGSSSKQKPLSDYSPQAIIEATLPKGSKRSRPTSSNTNSSSEGDAEIDERSSKRTKDSVSNEPLVQVAIPSIPIVPMKDPLKLPIPQDAKKDAPAAGNKVVFGAPKASSIPKEPSKLRFSYQPGNSPEGTTASKNDVPPTPKLAPAQIPPFAPKQPPSFSADSSKSNAASSSLGLGLPSSLAGRSSAAVTNKSKPPTPGGAKGAALNVPTADLPTFSFTFGSKSSVNGDSAGKRLALAVPKSELPTFSFTFGKTPDAPSKSSTSAVPSTSTGGFNWSAAGMKPPTAKGDTWTCSSCSLSNPNSATEKCTVCDAPRSAPVSAPATKGFDWAAAGVKAPSSSAGGSSWTCSTCMLSNPASATEKCTVCETPRDAPVAAASKAFDWSAAGMKAPGAGGSNWTCSTCMLSNPASAEKCTVCDASRP